MQAMCSFCRYCLNDDGSRKKRYVGMEGGPHSWECEDTDACRRECVEYQKALTADVVRLRTANQKMRGTLNRIAIWKGEFPASERTWPDGQPMSYGAAFGSNGERDFMRALALAAVEESDRSTASIR